MEVAKSKFQNWRGILACQFDTVYYINVSLPTIISYLIFRRTAASQERMRMISQLAKVNKKEDTFGMNDDDWDVYNTVRKDQGDSDSEEEQQKLTEYEVRSLQKFVSTSSANLSL